MRQVIRAAAPVLGLLLLLVSLYLLSVATQHSEDFGRLHPWLLLLNVTGVLLLLGLIGVNLYKLVKQLRNHVTGSRLTARLVAIFVVLALVPVSLVYYFSLQFINRGIDSWFDVRVETALDDSLALSRTSLELRVTEARSRMERLAQELRNVDNLVMPLRLHQARIETGAEELTLLGQNRIIAASVASPAGVLPSMPAEELLVRLGEGQPYVGIEPVGGDLLTIRVIVPLGRLPGDVEQRMLQGIFAVPQRVSGLAANVETAYTRYRELVYLRDPLRYSFTLTLTLILLLSLLGAVWGAFYAARRLVAPIQTLAEGTRAVAEGDYQTRLPLPARDEVGFLVLSFNEMTSRLALASEQARRSQQDVESERAHLEAVLSRLSSGVIALDADLKLRTANEAAGVILGVDLNRFEGKPLARAAQSDPMLKQFADACQVHIEAGETEWREEIVLQGKSRRRVVMCSSTTLPGGEGSPGGRVLVFDDLTVLLHAQREAAWGEVARRLAHEIKNPLTPIQLAAERMRSKYLAQMDPDQAEVLDRCTHTIVEQVDALKSMVNAFSDYARTPLLQVDTLNLNTLVSEVIELYRGREPRIKVRLDLDDQLPMIEADALRLRQMLHNLLKNAMEALADSDPALVTVSTRWRGNLAPPAAKLEVVDNGPGFPKEVLDQGFEPYVSTKTRGTGLGLAIVRKLVEEHGGTLDAGNNKDGGARVTIHLPISMNEPLTLIPVEAVDEPRRDTA